MGLAVHPNSRFVYVACNLDGSIAIFRTVNETPTIFDTSANGTGLESADRPVVAHENSAHAKFRRAPVFRKMAATTGVPLGAALGHQCRRRLAREWNRAERHTGENSFIRQRSKECTTTVRRSFRLSGSARWPSRR